MRYFTRGMCSLSILLLFACAAVAQTPTWRVDFVGSAPPSWSSVTAAGPLNDSGLVVGNTTVDLILRPWYGSPGNGLQLLPLPDGTTYATAGDVNNRGMIVGQVLIEDLGSRAILWRPGPSGYTTFLLPSGPDGQFPFDARAINDRGDIVGKYGVIFGSYHWSSATGVTPLDSFPDYPEAINNQRQILGDTYRMDLDTGILEDLGNPTDTGYNYLFSDLTVINDAGESGGYANTATGMSESKQPVRFTDGVGWKVFNSFPMITANVMGIAASGDTTFQLGIYGLWIYVEGYGSIGLENAVDPSFADWDLSDAFAPRMSRGGRLATNGGNASTGESGIILLSPANFDDLGGASLGALGTPVLTAYGVPAPGEPVRVRLASAALDSDASLLLSRRSEPVRKFGGTLYANPRERVLRLRTDSLGRAEVTIDWPNLPAGTTLYLQAVVDDEEQRTLSNALVGLTR